MIKVVSEYFATYDKYPLQYYPISFIATALIRNVCQPPPLI